MSKLLSSFVIFVTFCVVSNIACQNTKSSSEALDAAEVLPEAFSFTEQTQGLLFSVLDAQGKALTTDHLAEIPQELRARVLVVDLRKSPAERRADRYVYFSDLSKAADDGQYAAHPMSRFQVASKANLEGQHASNKNDVIIYSAPWCGFCKKAKAYLQQRGVAFVERNVEGSASAARELESKLRAVNASGSGVPVIEIDGQLIMGFDRPAIDAALAKRQAEK